MARPLSMDLREQLAAAVATGQSCRAVARQFAVGVSTVIRLEARRKQTGSLAPGQMGGHKQHALVEHEAAVRDLLATRPDLTIDELREELKERGIVVCRSAVWRFLRVNGLTGRGRRSAISLS